jgi:1A family penicillin-binding protein
MRIKNLLSIPDPIRSSLSVKKNFSWKNIRYWGLRLLISGFIFIVLLFVWFAKDLPTPTKIKNMQLASSTQLFDRNGKPIYALHGDIKRTIVESSAIPDVAKQATVAAEDKRFYTNHGVEMRSIARALYNDLTHKKSYVSGGSTITQQYVKNAMLDPKKTFTRKIKELILAMEVELMYNKDQILTMYLNTIPYGSNAYGIESGSQTYFNKDAKDLTLPEAATLAAIVQAPTYYSPYGTHVDARLNRTNYVLNSMVDMKYITKEQADQAKIDVKNLTFSKPKEYIVAPHFVQFVKDQLVEKYGEQMVESGGLKVTTTLDLDKQALAQQAVSDAADKRFEGIDASNAALVSIDPKTGQILAMVGSIDYFNNDIQGQVNVADSLRQPGSSFKPIVYATAFKKDYNPAFTLWDVPTDFGGGYTPKNYDGSTHGPVSMRTALANSLNIPAVKTLYLAGVSNALNTAHDMGITSLKGSADQYGLSLVLGSGEVTLTDLTTAYGVFANQGDLSPTTPVLKVIDYKGNTIDEYKDGNGKKNVLDPQIAYQISSILSDNNARSMVFGSRSALNFNDRDVAVKTGTTTLYKDAWTLGYTPSVVTGVWVGNNSGKPMTAGAAGAMAAAPIFHQYMQSVLGSSENEPFNKPSGITDVTVDKLSNKLPTSNSPQTITDVFAAWQVPVDRDDIHQTLRIDKFTGKLATTDCPDQYTTEQTFTNLHSEVPDNPNWESPVRSAAAAYGIDINYPPKETSCAGITNAPTIKITSPVNNTSVSDGFTVSAQVTSASSISYVEFFADDVSVGTDNSSPYTKTMPSLSAGSHTISVTAVNDASISSTDKITVTVIKSSSPPGSPTLKTINGGAGSISISWLNPSDSDLSKVRVYGSQTEGQLGTVLQTENVSQGTTSSITINGLQSGKTYWITLKAVNSSSVESTDNTQHSVLTL